MEGLHKLMRKVRLDITCVRRSDHGWDYDRWTGAASHHLVVVKVLRLKSGGRADGNYGTLRSSIDPLAEKLWAVKGACCSYRWCWGKVGGSLHQFHRGIGAREGFRCSSRGAWSRWRLVSESRHGKTGVGIIHGEGSSLSHSTAISSRADWKSSRCQRPCSWVGGGFQEMLGGCAARSSTQKFSHSRGNCLDSGGRLLHQVGVHSQTLGLHVEVIAMAEAIRSGTCCRPNCLATEHHSWQNTGLGQIRGHRPNIMVLHHPQCGKGIKAMLQQKCNCAFSQAFPS